MIEEGWIKAATHKMPFLFALEYVEYLGHVISPEGLKTNAKLVAMAKEF